MLLFINEERSSVPLMGCAPNEMGTVKTLSVNELKRVTGISQKQYKQVAWHTTTVVIKQLLTVKEYIDTVHNIFRYCKTPDGEVVVALLDFATRVSIISSYSFVNLPDSIDDLYYFAYASDLYELIYRNANKAQVDSIRETIKLMIGCGETNE